MRLRLGACVEAGDGVGKAHAVKMRPRSGNREQGTLSTEARPEKRIPSYTPTHLVLPPSPSSCVRRPETAFLRREDLNATIGELRYSSTNGSPSANRADAL